MKKRILFIISFILLICLLSFSLAACGEKKTNNETTSEKESVSQTETQTTTITEETTIADSESVTTETISVEGDIQTIPAAYHTSGLGYTMLYYTDNMKFSKTADVDTYNIKNRVTGIIDPNAFVSVQLKPGTTASAVMNEVVTSNTITEPVEDVTFTINNYAAKHAILNYTSGTTDFYMDFYTIQDGDNVYLLTEKVYYMEGSGTSSLLYTSLSTFTIN